MFYLAKNPAWLQWFWPGRLWKMPACTPPCLYLTFDDGPTPGVTDWVLDQLAAHKARATFFCIGNNVVAHPALYQRLSADGHRVGNHSQNHVKGARHSLQSYLADVKTCEEHVQSNLFRPPYGRLGYRQSKALQKRGYRIVMYDVLSADFDRKLSPQECTSNVLENAGNGSIVVFHDSEKAFPRLKTALPETLRFFSEKGYVFRSL